MDRTLIWQIAFRYLRGKRSVNAVPILSRISMVAIAVSSGAMIVVFSVFNGMEFIVKDMYKAFYPDVKVSVARGKFFAVDSTKMNAVAHIKGVKNITAVIEDKVIAKEDNIVAKASNNSAGNEAQNVLILRGIDKNYFNVNNISQFIVQGDSNVTEGRILSTAIIGTHIMNQLGTNVNDEYSRIRIFYLNAAVTNFQSDPSGAYQTMELHPSGAYHINDDYDSKYILAPLATVQGVFRQAGHISSIEISAEPDQVTNIKEQLAQLLGSAYKIENRYEQNKTLYMVMSGEKWAIYAILLLVLLIASFNMVGALSMLVLEKQKDIAILKAMGALPTTIRRIFLLEGILWSLIGGLSGILIGVILCLIQLKFGIIQLGASFEVDAFPVRLVWTDFILVIGTILAVGLLASWYPSIRATQAKDPTLKSA